MGIKQNVAAVAAGFSLRCLRCQMQAKACGYKCGYIIFLDELNKLLE